MAGVLRVSLADDDPEARKAKWEAAGSPLFGPLYTYDDLQNVEPKGRMGRAGPKPNAHVKTPASWPSDTKIDPGPWTFWLPQGWKQAKRTHEVSGLVLQCYFSPDNKRFWHKRDIEKFLGRTLPKQPPKQEKEDDKSKVPRVRYVTDDDAIPSWPDDDWLPKDWKVGFRQKQAALHRICVPPNQDHGFCYHKSDVLNYLESNGEKGLAPFGTSVANKACGNHRKSSRSRSRASRPAKFAKAEDYEEVRNFKVFQLPLDLEDRKAGSVEGDGLDFTKEKEELEQTLKYRGFKETNFVLVGFFKHKKGKELPPKPMIAEGMCGLWYKRPDDFNGKDCYQKIGQSKAEGPIGRQVYCSKLHIFWSKEYSCWKMGALNNDLAGYLRCDEDVAQPWKTTKRWKVVKQQLCT